MWASESVFHTQILWKFCKFHFLEISKKIKLWQNVMKTKYCGENLDLNLTTWYSHRFAAFMDVSTVKSKAKLVFTFWWHSTDWNRLLSRNLRELGIRCICVNGRIYCSRFVSNIGLEELLKEWEEEFEWLGRRILFVEFHSSGSCGILGY